MIEISISRFQFDREKKQHINRLKYFILIFQFYFLLTEREFFPFFPFQNDFNTGLDLSEARASLLSGDVVELTNATSTDSTSMKLMWEVRISFKQNQKLH